MTSLPLGKLPPEFFSHLLSRIENHDPRLILGPGMGLDCAVIDFGDRYLVAKSDPITFTAEDIGWYAVQVNANDIATTGAIPRWFLGTLLLPEDDVNEAKVEAIFEQIGSACAELDVAWAGGHTEVTSGIDRAILCGTMLGEVEKQNLITPPGVKIGDHVILTKGIPIEAISILAREAGSKLNSLEPEQIQRAIRLLHEPGISILREAQIAIAAGIVTGMHDPTEGGLASGLWELADATEAGLEIELDRVPILPEAESICQILKINPYEAIASGALLICTPADSVAPILQALISNDIAAVDIGKVTHGKGVIFEENGIKRTLPRPQRDALSVFFEKHADSDKSKNESG
jgi:hydrogenase expression/formation protein HypE